ncbi:MAG: redoxin family protein [Acidobacteriota bacterium]|nr:redoxin family protein [Acidobacteriota bacterium]
MKYSLKTFVFFATFAVIFFANANLFAQKTKNPPKAKTSKSAVVSQIPKVTQIDEIKIKSLLKPNGKPLLVNFWATWCVPCREEFPELVEIDKEYKDKIDFITISLDDLAEINRDVPKFLVEMKATMSAYLLKTTDENAVISSISKDWAGGLPFSILYNKDGEIVHFKQGKIKPEIVKAEIDKIIVKDESSQNFTETSEEETVKSLSNSLEFTDQDKALIIRQILKKHQPTKKYASQESTETHLVINLSEKNISPELLPEFSQIEYKLLKTDDIENYKGKWLNYQAFEEFEVKNNRVKVVFSQIGLAKGFFPTAYVISYKYHKNNGEWQSEIIGTRRIN